MQLTLNKNQEEEEEGQEEQEQEEEEREEEEHNRIRRIQRVTTAAPFTCTCVHLHHDEHSLHKTIQSCQVNVHAGKRPSRHHITPLTSPPSPPSPLLPSSSSSLQLPLLSPSPSFLTLVLFRLLISSPSCHHVLTYWQLLDRARAPTANPFSSSYASTRTHHHSPFCITMRACQLVHSSSFFHPFDVPFNKYIMFTQKCCIGQVCFCVCLCVRCESVVSQRRMHF